MSQINLCSFKRKVCCCIYEHKVYGGFLWWYYGGAIKLTYTTYKSIGVGVLSLAGIQINMYAVLARYYEMLVWYNVSCRIRAVHFRVYLERKMNWCRFVVIYFIYTLEMTIFQTPNCVVYLYISGFFFFVFCFYFLW